MGGGGAARLSSFCSLFRVQQTTSGIGHHIKYSGIFFGLATNTLNVRNHIKCHEQVLSLQPVISPERYDIPSPFLGDAQKV